MAAVDPKSDGNPLGDFDSALASGTREEIATALREVEDNLLDFLHCIGHLYRQAAMFEVQNAAAELHDDEERDLSLRFAQAYASLATSATITEEAASYFETQ